MRVAVVALLAAGIVAGALALARSGRLAPVSVRDRMAAEVLAGVEDVDELALMIAYQAADDRMRRGYA